MPFLVPIFIAVVAASPEIGAALGLAGSIGGAIAGGVAAALDVGVVIGDIAAGAIVGAAAGAAGAAASGTDPGNGALWGGVSGGLSGGLGPVVGEVTGLAPDALTTGATDSLSRAIGQGLATTATSAAQGAPLGTALEYGALAGVGSFAGDQFFGPASVAGTTGPDTTPVAPGTEAITVHGPSLGPTFNPTAGLTGTQGAKNTEAVTSTAQGGISGTGATTGLTAPGTESVTVSADKPGNTTPSILDLIQQSPTTQTAEKGALTTALFQLLFPQGGSQFSGGGGAATAPGSAPGGSSPAAAAAVAAQSGQTGSSSAYAPGGPIVGDPTGATKSSPWNVESLRTTQGVA